MFRCAEFFVFCVITLFCVIPLPLFSVKHIVRQYTAAVVAIRNLYFKALSHVILEVEYAHLVEALIECHLSSHELLTVRTVVVYNLLAVDLQS